MPPVTYPNQRLVRVHRQRAAKDFLGIKNENWMAASRILGAPALRLYLYLAANADNYTLALSPATITRDIGMARSTYGDQFKKLVNMGYLVPAGGNTYDFYEVPQTATQTKNDVTADGQDFEECAADGQEQPQTDTVGTGDIIEINNKETINNAEINNQNESPSVTVFYPKVKEITIPRPVAEGKNRPKPREQKKQDVFEF